MLNSTRAHVEDVRALAGAIALGSGAGLLIGAAYLAGSGVHTAPRASRSSPPAQDVASKGPASSASTSAPKVKLAMAPPGFAGLLRDRFHLSDALTRAAARPFRFSQVADAPTDQTCLAEVVYFEARGEPAAGQQAVAQVVLNRVRHPAFPKTVCGVAHQRSASSCQFAFACASERPATGSAAWRRSEQVASAALHGAVMAAVGDATHFQNARGGPFAGLMKVAQVGAHVFYRFGGHAGSAGMFRQTPVPSTAPARVELAKLEPSRVLTVISPGPAPAPAAETTPTPKLPAPKLPAPKLTEARLAEPATLQDKTVVVARTPPASVASPAPKLAVVPVRLAPAVPPAAARPVETIPAAKALDPAASRPLVTVAYTPS